MNDEPDEIESADRQHVRTAIAALRQHFDTVQIFVTRGEPADETLGFADGTGNWYARYGQVTEWLENGGATALTEGGE